MVENVKRVFRSRDGAPRPFRVLDLDDVESSKMKRMAAMEPWSSSRKYVRGLEWLKLSASEQRRLPEFDCLLVCSEKDRRVVQAKWRRSRVEVFANGADVNTACSEPRDDGRTVVFLGAMNYQPNEDAVLFFVELVLPILRQRIPDARFVIAGKSPSAKVRALNNGKDVLVTGYVQDKAAVLSSCTVFVVPIRMGGGTRIKILEAMAAGVPVVSTTVGCEGIDATPDEAVVIADSPEDFAAACGTLLLDPAGRRSLARAGRLLVQRQYQWEDIGPDTCKRFGIVSRDTACQVVGHPRARDRSRRQRRTSSPPRVPMQTSAAGRGAFEPVRHASRTRVWFRFRLSAVSAWGLSPSAPVRLSFTQLLKRVFDIDIAQCPRVAAVP